MSARLTYTSGDLGAESDAEFEARLADARAGAAEPLPHLVGGEELRLDRQGRPGAWDMPQCMREQSRTIVE